ncbi:HAD-IA family hydrolase [Plantibacter sp. LMC-P-059a]|uniref:HAD-IA family hydrolase n=1 Tax=Plantibacter sp. LMC-P-059a TaxID=3040297 RepID=UPI0025507B9A|nr:HAD-IA family hydrolase [Plantibacter sp. LMC-P-059a]
MPERVFFFDCDKTLYDYDFRKRLPALARLTGVSQYRLAKQWWVGGHEAAANIGEYPTSDDYLAVFAEVTGYPLSLDEWREARAAAMTPVPGALATLRRAASLGTVSLLSNNPIPFRDSFAQLAPEAAAVLGENDLVSAVLGAEKPEPRIYTRALSRYGVAPERAILIDDSAANCAGATAVGMHAFHLTKDASGAFDIAGLDAAVDAFVAATP